MFKDILAEDGGKQLIVLTMSIATMTVASMITMLMMMIFVIIFIIRMTIMVEIVTMMGMWTMVN